MIALWSLISCSEDGDDDGFGITFLLPLSTATEGGPSTAVASGGPVGLIGDVEGAGVELEAGGEAACGKVLGVGKEVAFGKVLGVDAGILGGVLVEVGALTGFPPSVLP